MDMYFKKKIIISMMDINTKISIKYFQTEFNDILKRSYTMIKLDLFQTCRDGSTDSNQ
jgi:hypothetical protein